MSDWLPDDWPVITYAIEEPPIDLVAMHTALQRAILHGWQANGTGCTNARHDHTTTLLQSGDQIDEPVAMFCWTCGAPAHLDLLMSTPQAPIYCHDSSDAPRCTAMDPNWLNPCQTRRQ